MGGSRKIHCSPSRSVVSFDGSLLDRIEEGEVALRLPIVEVAIFADPLVVGRKGRRIDCYHLKMGPRRKHLFPEA